MRMAFHVPAQAFEAARQTPDFGRAQRSRSTQRPHVGLIDREVVVDQSLVQREGLTKFFEQRVPAAPSKPPAPELHPALLRRAFPLPCVAALLAPASLMGSPRILMKPSASRWS